MAKPARDHDKIMYSIIRMVLEYFILANHANSDSAPTFEAYGKKQRKVIELKKKKTLQIFGLRQMDTNLSLCKEEFEQCKHTFSPLMWK